MHFLSTPLPKHTQTHRHRIHLQTPGCGDRHRLRRHRCLCHRRRAGELQTIRLGHLNLHIHAGAERIGRANRPRHSLHTTTFTSANPRPDRHQIEMLESLVYEVHASARMLARNFALQTPHKSAGSILLMPITGTPVEGFGWRHNQPSYMKLALLTDWEAVGGPSPAASEGTWRLLEETTDYRRRRRRQWWL